MKTIVFICTANIARSPMAQILFNNKMVEMGLKKYYQAESAGSWGVDDIPAAIEGQQVMRQRGLDLSAHRSRVVTQEIIENADLVLTMERGHKEALKIEFPEKSGKIFLLSEIVNTIYDIEDPYNRGTEAFEETAQELESILANGINEILKLAGPLE
jgi:protein-tyrosine-phosphatase